jgi:hypothetical protein
MAFNIFSGSGKRVADGPPYSGVKTAFDGEPALLFDYSAGAPSPFCLTTYQFLIALRVRRRFNFSLGRARQSTAALITTGI